MMGSNESEFLTSTISVTKTDWGDRDNIGGPDHVFLESLSLWLHLIV